jgi:hypothetical protein
MAIRRRLLLYATTPFVFSSARGQSGVWPDWLGTYSGALAFYGSIPLEDIYPPPVNPHVDLDDRAPFGAAFGLRQEDGNAVVWLRIDGGPMQTAPTGETLRFGLAVSGLAKLVSADAKPAPRDATLTVRPDSLGTEALFTYSDGSFWRRHVNMRFTPTGAEMIVWVFDASGTRARTWRGSTIKQKP